MAQTKSNPWAVRIAVAGLVFLVLGAGAIFANMEQIDEASSPKKINEAVITGSGAETVDLSASCYSCLLYTSPSPRDGLLSRMPSSA